MDGLDLLKKDWKKSEGNFKQVTEAEIYKMIHKNSSSIVRWIFIISMIEFLLWSGLSFFMKDTKEMLKFNEYHAEFIMYPVMAIGYIVLGYFFYQFFMNYKKISTTQNAATLIKQILRTRKVVHQYIWFNIIYGISTAIIVSIIQVCYDEQIIGMLQGYEKVANKHLIMTIYIFICVFMMSIFGGLLYILYRIIYGTLLRRLNKNYQELKKMEI